MTTKRELATLRARIEAAAPPAPDPVPRRTAAELAASVAHDWAQAAWYLGEPDPTRRDTCDRAAVRYLRDAYDRIDLVEARLAAYPGERAAADAVPQDIDDAARWCAMHFDQTHVRPITAAMVAAARARLAASGLYLESEAELDALDAALAPRLAAARVANERADAEWRARNATLGVASR